jgi:hypothetical protein
MEPERAIFTKDSLDSAFNQMIHVPILRSF